MSSKNKWQTPQLIVLVKGRAEESVLADCKLVGPPPGAGNFRPVQGCKNQEDCKLASGGS